MKIKLIISSLLFLIFTTLLVGILYISAIKTPLNSEGKTVIINANKNTFSGVIAENSSKFNKKIFIKLYNRFNDVNISVKQGQYEFPSDISLKEVISALETGKYNTSIKKVTIPEGYTLEQIAETLDKNEIVGSEEFMMACKNYPLPSYIKRNELRRYGLEGFLFPDTYIFEKGMNANNVISIMLNRLDDVFSEIETERGIKISDSEKDRIIIKASVIEREVSENDEKFKVSSVIDNRLKIGMKLQIDATVLYAMGVHKDRVFYKDLKTPSKYNTYYTDGLPIGPISNPGKDSIEAAIFPDKTEYIYYMTKDGINHEFFEEYKDFLEYKNS